MAQGQRKTVGKTTTDEQGQVWGTFTIDEEGHLYGPKQYMEEQGNAKLRKILDGKDEVFNMTAHLSPDAETALLVHMQTDYAGWLGFRQMLSWTKSSKEQTDGR